MKQILILLFITTFSFSTNHYSQSRTDYIPIKLQGGYLTDNSEGIIGIKIGYDKLIYQKLFWCFEVALYRHNKTFHEAFINIGSGIKLYLSSKNNGGLFTNLNIMFVPKKTRGSSNTTYGIGLMFGYEFPFSPSGNVLVLGAGINFFEYSRLSNIMLDVGYAFSL